MTKSHNKNVHRRPTVWRAQTTHFWRAQTNPEPAAGAWTSLPWCARSITESSGRERSWVALLFLIHACLPSTYKTSFDVHSVLPCVISSLGFIWDLMSWSVPKLLVVLRGGSGVQSGGEVAWVLSASILSCATVSATLILASETPWISSKQVQPFGWKRQRNIGSKTWQNKFLQVHGWECWIREMAWLQEPQRPSKAFHILGQPWLDWPLRCLGYQTEDNVTWASLNLCTFSPLGRSGWNLQVLNCAINLLGPSVNFLISGSSQAERCPSTVLGGGFSRVAIAGTVLSFLDSATFDAMSIDLEASMVPTSQDSCCFGVFSFRP